MLIPTRPNHLAQNLNTTIITRAAAIPPDRERKNEGCKNFPTIKLLIITRMRTIKKTSLPPHHCMARMVAIFASPNRTNGKGVGTRFSREDNMDDMAISRAIWVYRRSKKIPYWVTASTSEGLSPSMIINTLLGIQTRVSPALLICPIFLHN